VLLPSSRVASHMLREWFSDFYASLKKDGV
jgi:hypothetical protein